MSQFSSVSQLICLFVLQEGQLRRPVATGSPGLDFEVDFTELESFGESLPIKKKTSQGAAQKAELLGKPSVAKMAPEVPEPPNAPQALNTNTVSSKGEGPAKEDALESGSNSHEEDGDSSWTDIEDDSAEEDGDASTDVRSKQGPVHASVTGQEKESEEFATPAKRTRTASEASADSDESILYIADMSSPQPHSAADKKLTHPPPNKVTQPAHTAPQPSTPLSLQARAGNRRAGKMPRLEGGCDQLGQILRMQSAMLKHSPSSRTQETPRPVESRPAAGLTEPSCHSLVKSSVTSFLEGKEREDGVTNTGPTLTLHLNTQQKCKYLHFHALTSRRQICLGVENIPIFFFFLFQFNEFSPFKFSVFYHYAAVLRLYCNCNHIICVAQMLQNPVQSHLHECIHCSKLPLL